MEPRFRPASRDQQFLLPPDVREWLPPGHPALFVSELVEELDLGEFVANYGSSRDRGRPAYHPQVMVGIALYASMTSVLSSRRIERLLATDAGFRVVAMNERPDHATICRFLGRHREALAGLFAQVVGLAAEAGLVDPTLVAVDGTKMAGDASADRNVSLGELRRRYRAWSETVEDADVGADGEEPGPIEEMLERDSMREWIRRRLDECAREGEDRKVNLTDPDSGLMPRSGGGWVQGYNAQAAATPGGIVVAGDVTASPADTTMLEPMCHQIADAVEAATGEPAGVVVGDAGYWDTETIEEIDADEDLPDPLIATGRTTPTEAPEALPEPDTTSYERDLADYHTAIEEEWRRRVAVIAQVAAGTMLLRQAAEALDMSVPRVGELSLAYRAGGADAIRPQQLASRPKPRPPARPTRAARQRHHMDTRLASPAGRSFYRMRQAIIEPVFGDIKTNRRITRFLRRGLDNVRAEWHWILTGHNLTLLHAARHNTPRPAG